MKHRLLRPEDGVRQPWRNGGGTTTEIASHHERSRLLWRASIADVAADGPFSDFEGYDRVIMLLEGAGMSLAFGGHPPVRVDRAFAPVPFDGGWPPDCRLIDGPVRDFNLMVDRSRARAALALVGAGAARFDEAWTSGDWTLCHVLAGEVEYEVLAEAGRCAHGHTLLLEGAPGVPVRLRPATNDARAAFITIHRTTP